MESRDKHVKGQINENATNIASSRVEEATSDLELYIKKSDLYSYAIEMSKSDSCISGSLFQ